jgi:hypothetical protein
VRVVIFILLVVATFGSITLLGRQGGLSNGYQTFISYGWPQPWLRADVVGIDITGKNYDRAKTERIVDWRVFPLSVGISAAIAALLSSPLFLFLSAAPRKHYTRVLLAAVLCVAAVWGVHPLFGIFHGPPPNGDGWQVWVRMHQPFFLSSPSWFANGVYWRLAEAFARLVAVGIITFGIFGFIRFQQHEKPVA